jgi:hypothetical protein
MESIEYGIAKDIEYGTRRLHRVSNDPPEFFVGDDDPRDRVDLTVVDQEDMLEERPIPLGDVPFVPFMGEWKRLRSHQVS